MRLGALAVVLVALAFGCLGGGGVASGSVASTPGLRALTLYSLAEQEQFVNNLDDRTRGEGRNPFGTYSDLSPTTVSEAKGPFPGDEAIFSFNIYRDKNLKVRAGAAIFTCQYNFNKNAFCDASFQLSTGGTLIADGAFNFNASRFMLAVVGGYGRYSNASGDVYVTPSAGHAQRLSFAVAYD
jgi:hypothetical protein